MTTYIYIIRCGDFAKVGYSRTPKARLDAIDKLSPVEPELIAQFPGTKRTEILLQCYLHDLHVRKEWFRWSPIIADIAHHGLPEFPEFCGHSDCHRTRASRKRAGWRPAGLVHGCPASPEQAA